MIYCDGSTVTIIADTECTVPLASFTASPFNLVQGDDINIKVSVYNDYGESPLSEMGGGALIQVVPDAPINLANVLGITLDDRIGFIWDEGENNGGNSVIDYQVWYDDGLANDVYIELATALTEREYIATDLYSGSFYKFKVRSRNSVGYGEFSDPIEILAAQIPDIPLAPTTTISERWYVIIDWVAPYTGGTPIISYTIEIRTTDNSVFAVDAADCDGTNSVIV